MTDGGDRTSLAGMSVGVEIADAATRLSVLIEGQRDGRRWRARLPTPPPPDEAVGSVVELVGQAQDQSHPPATASAPEVKRLLAGVGVAVWGVVDARMGEVRAMPPGTAWEGYPLAARLSQALEAPVHLDSATNAGALAEARLGRGAGYDSMLYVMLGRDVTSAFVVQGQIVRGEHGSAGMLGHVEVCWDGPRCACGVHGHLLPIASAQAIVRATIGRASASDESTAAMLSATGGRAEALTAAQVVRMAQNGEPAARTVIEAATEALAIALANAAAMLDPGIIVVDGPLVEAGDAFFDPLRAALNGRRSRFAIPTSLVVSELYPSTVALGAYLLASTDGPRGGGTDGGTPDMRGIIRDARDRRARPRRPRTRAGGR